MARPRTPLVKMLANDCRRAWPWADRGRGGYTADDVVREIESLRAWIDLRLIVDGLVRL